MPEPLTRKETWLTLAGTGLGAVLILSYVGGIAAWLRQPWQRIGIRVAGSWTAASALLVLALALVGPKASG
jgi:urease accessory protein